jgi:3-deoxy-7-phosphoheptulonate synthase
MLIVMETGVTDDKVAAVVRAIEDKGFKAHPIPGSLRTAIGITGNQGPLDPAEFEMLPGVVQAIPVTQPFKLVSREVKREDSVIEVSGQTIGGSSFCVIAGPCAVESEQQTIAVAKRVKAAGAHFLRGGAFKPRTSPYSFQGLGAEGLAILSRARRETGLPIVTEALDTDTVDLVAEHADVIQVGARNMQNYSLLREVGHAEKPVLLKRGLAATIEEWLMSAEHVLSQGNSQVILCERGIRTFETYTRNTLDLNAIPVVKERSHLPVIVDPSHGTGIRDKVAPMARAAIAAGADGLIIEVHHDPDHALSDGAQSLHPEQFEELVAQIRTIAGVVGRRV